MRGMNRPKTQVLYVHWGDEGIRGSERVLLDLLSGIDRTQFTPVLWCNAQTMATAARALDVQTRVSPMPILLGWDAPRLDVAGYRRLLAEGGSIIREFGVQLVHANSGAPNQWMVPAARQARIPLLAHLHAIYRLRERCTLLLQQAPMIVGCSRAVVRPFEQDGVPDSRLRVIYNGVDTERLDPGDAQKLRESLGIDPSAFVIACAGALITLKGFDTVIRALGITRGRGIDAHLIVAGEGPERGNLTRLAGQLGVGAQTHLVGETGNIGTILRAADAVAVSSHIESFGLVAAEAGAAGRAVVATNVGGIPEVVEDGITGLLVAPRDEKAFAEALTRLARDSAMRTALGDAARRRVLGKFSAQAAARSFENLYSELSDRPPGEFGWSGLGFSVAPFARLGINVIGRRLGMRVAD